MRPSTREDDRSVTAPAPEVAIVFDMDGTLLDGREPIVAAVQEGLEATYRHFRLPVPAPDPARIAGAIGLPTPLFFRTAYDALTVPADLRDRFTAEFEVRSTRAEIAALERGETALYEGMEEVLRRLAERGHPLALFSNANAPYFAAVVRVHRLDRLFRRSLSLEEAASRRVARTKVGIVRHLSQDCPRAVVVGDRVHDIEAGRRIGARTVGCLYGFGDPGELDAADWKVERPREILALPLARGGDPAPG